MLWSLVLLVAVGIAAVVAVRAPLSGSAFWVPLMGVWVALAAVSYLASGESDSTKSALIASEAVYARDRALVERLRAALAGAGWPPVSLPEANRSSIVAIPLGERDPGHLLRALKERQVLAAARDGNLRLSIHFYNHEDDIDRLVAALSEV